MKFKGKEESGWLKDSEEDSLNRVAACSLMGQPEPWRLAADKRKISHELSVLNLTVFLSVGTLITSVVVFPL